MIGLVLPILDLGMILVMLYVADESNRENERQAVMVSILGAVFHIALMYVILDMPGLRLIPMGYFSARARKPNFSSLKGIRGYVIGDAPRPDERDSVTRRYRLVKGTPQHRTHGYAAFG